VTSRDRQFLVRQGKGGTEKRGASQGPDSLRLLRHRFFSFVGLGDVLRNYTLKLSRV